jgi:hypothetical protein
MHDFWVDELSGHLSLSVSHAARASVFSQGASKDCILHPAINISLSKFHLKIRADGLSLRGERGTKVPDMKVQLLDLVVDMILEVRLRYVCISCVPTGT